MDQGQAAPQPQKAAPLAPPATAAAPLVLPAPPLPLVVPLAPPAFALGPGRSHAVLNFDDPNTRATATKLYNKAIAPLEAKFDGEADNLAVFLMSVCNRARRFNWHRLITMPIDDGTMQNLLTHYRQVSLDSTRAHAATYVNTLTRDAQDNDMYYYFLADLLTNEFRTTVLLYADIYMVMNVPVASSLLKQTIILTRVDNPASTMHIREMLTESKQKLLLLKGNIPEFNQWVHKQMGCLHAREQEAVDLLYYLWKAYKAAPDEEFVMYIKDLKSQSNDGRATYTAEDLMVCAKNTYKVRLLDEENTWGKPTDEQEMVAMTAEINSLKKECRGVADKTSKSTTKEKKPVAKKTKEQKKTKDSTKKKATEKWAWKNKPPRRMTARRTTHLLSPLRARNTSGAPTTIMGQACGHFITQKTSKRAKHLQAQQPKPTSPPLTLWTATRIWNDDRTRVKRFLGSGWPSHITSYGWFYHKTWACHLLPSVSSLPSLSLSSLRLMPQGDRSPTCLRNNGPPRANGTNP